MSEKIPCTVGILTLNADTTLRRALLSVKDFAEIVICDGNSTDGTLSIAKEFGAKIIKQFDSGEPNLSCVTCKDTVRNRNMDAASYDWYLFLDADDALEPETVEEIRSIVRSPSPAHLVYRMRSRIFVDGVHKHTSVYPAYQTRLFHRTTGARFKGKVHERIVFDADKYPVGTMHSHYDFHLSSARVDDYWAYQKKYTRWELETAKFSSLSSFLYWGLYRRLKIIAGFFFYRTPKLYLLHGFKDSMPLRYEFLTAWQHVYLLYLFIIHLPTLLKRS